MSSTITLKVAALTSVVTSSKSDVDTGNILKWFVADKVLPPPNGLTTAQLNQYYLDAAATELARYIRQEASKNRLKELRAAQVSVEEQAATDTQL